MEALGGEDVGLPRHSRYVEVAERGVELKEELSQPRRLNHYIGDGTILSFSIGGPGDQIIVEKHCIA